MPADNSTTQYSVVLCITCPLFCPYLLKNRFIIGLAIAPVTLHETHFCFFQDNNQLLIEIFLYRIECIFSQDAL